MTKISRFVITQHLDDDKRSPFSHAAKNRCAFYAFYIILQALSAPLSLLLLAVTFYTFLLPVLCLRHTSGRRCYSLPRIRTDSLAIRSREYASSHACAFNNSPTPLLNASQLLGRYETLSLHALSSMISAPT